LNEFTPQVKQHTGNFFGFIPRVALI